MTIANTLLNDLVIILWNGINACYSWIVSIFNRFQLPITVLLVAFVSVSAIYKFILSPVLSGSDFAKYRSNPKKYGK